jgi:hypothetical protein
MLPPFRRQRPPRRVVWVRALVAAANVDIPWVNRDPEIIGPMSRACRTDRMAPSAAHSIR